jgi:hypothetical protein
MISVITVSDALEVPSWNMKEREKPRMELGQEDMVAVFHYRRMTTAGMPLMSSLSTEWPRLPL